METEEKQNFGLDLYDYLWNGFWVLVIIILAYSNGKLTWDNIELFAGVALAIWLLLGHIDRRIERIQKQVNYLSKNQNS